MKDHDWTCKLEDMRFDISLYGSTSIDGTGEPDQDEAIANLLDSVREWSSDDEPYYCPNCDEHFRRWEEARDHISDRARED